MGSTSFPERVQVATLATPLGMIEVLNVHVPAATSSGIAVKVATFEGIARYLSQSTSRPRIMCGDFNTPQAETDGRITYWGNAHQQQAERAVIEGHASTGLRDAFRFINGSAATGASWCASNSVLRRYDHVFASEDLVPLAATYGDLEQIRTSGMSDHAPLRVELALSHSAGAGVAPAAVTTPFMRPTAPRPTPVRPSTGPVKQEEPRVATTDDTDLHAFLKTLAYRKDVRNPPDDGRRKQFRIGWNKASQGPAITEKKLLAELSWQNLGYRAGKAFVPATDTKIYATFDRLAAIYLRERA